ncbi:hypothetical protein PV379_00165 [Streptomyces caniscabiei]|uniref:hypothetical protein n=1 Tax=Streptomyces caniscabiei TaxID=2746961 RepID=UPI0029B3E32B|nr:hypothetical protein [Streptomyces caniscabiei]MDX2775773.1 hypothetical protein [Streptomyces caniscabiei]
MKEVMGTRTFDDTVESIREEMEEVAAEVLSESERMQRNHTLGAAGILGMEMVDTSATTLTAESCVKPIVRCNELRCKA